MTDNQKAKIETYTDTLRVLSQFKDAKGDFDYRVGKLLESLTEGIVKVVDEIQNPVLPLVPTSTTPAVSDKEVPF